MTTQPSSADLSQGLADLLARRASPAEFARQLFRLTLEQTRAADPLLAEMLRACAIPRRFDAAIIGVLRDAPDDRATNQRLLEGLLPFSFVLTHKEGGYVYHDNTRDMLLEDWRAAENRDQFDRFNQRLVTFYETAHKKSPETEQVAPLLEALYHETLRSAPAGYSFFNRYCEAYEASGRLTVCLSLVNATRTYLEWLPPDSGQEPLLKWLRYWEARLSRGLRRTADAEKLLNELIPQTGDDTKLKLWTLGELGGALHDQDRLREARPFYEEELRLAEQTREDPYNLPVSYYRVARLHWSLGEPELALARYREAIQSARRENNLRMEAFALLDMSGVLQDQGEWTEAFDTALEAMHLVRSRFSQDFALQQTLAGRLMALVARRDPRLLDTIFAETLAMKDMQEPLLLLDLRSQFINFLQQGGQLRRAETLWQDLHRDADSYRETTFGTDLLFRAALLGEERGRVAEATERYGEILRRAQSGRGTAWHEAAALSNRALANAQRARWQEVEPDLQQATARWEKMGHEKLSAYMQVYRAGALCQQGRLTEAQQSLDAIGDAFHDSELNYQADRHEIQGNVHRDQAQWAEAREHYQQAVEMNLALHQWKRAARSLNELAAIAAEQGDWDEAARRSAEAQALWQRLAEMNQYQPSDETHRADRENADGLRCFCMGGDERPQHLLRARELFRSACERAPDNVWYHLNLSYACAELEEWTEAVQTLETVLQRAPEWLRSPVLQARLAEYDIKQGDGFFKLGRLDEAQAKYEAGFTRAATAENLSVRAGLRARMGFVAACRADLPNALEQFRQSLELRRQAQSSNPAWSLMNDCSHLVTSLPTYRALNESLRTLSDDPTLDATQRRRLREARFEFIRDKYLRLRRTAEGAALPPSFNMLPVVTPIALEADARLFPQVDNSPRDRVINVEAPAMQTRIQDRMGVKVPGIRLRGNEDFPQGYYLLMLHEIPMVAGSVDADEKCCPDADACQRLGLDGHAAFNPLSEEGATWLSKSEWEQAEKSGLPLWDAYQYMMLHLESLICRHLATFLGVQEVQNMLEEGEKSETEGISLRKREPLDDATRLCLVQVLQGLVREEVPVKNLTAVLSAFAEANLECPQATDVIEKVRMVLRSDLPGNEGTRRLVGLSADFEREVENWVQERDGKTFFAIPPENTQDLLSAMREHLAGEVIRGRLALVVRNARLRPFVRRLIELEFPSLPVLSQAELAEGLTPPSEQVKYASDFDDEGAEEEDA
jgi:tetratricopeptide (TPR) repeat protein